MTPQRVALSDSPLEKDLRFPGGAAIAKVLALPLEGVTLLATMDVSPGNDQIPPRMSEIRSGKHFEARVSVQRLLRASMNIWSEIIISDRSSAVRAYLTNHWTAIATVERSGFLLGVVVFLSGYTRLLSGFWNPC